MFHGSSKWLRRILTDGRPLIWLLYKSLLPEDILFPSNVWLCVRNPTMWPFKWKPSNSIFHWQFFKAYFWLFESLDNEDITLCATVSYKNKTSSAILYAVLILTSSDEIQLRLANLLSRDTLPKRRACSQAGRNTMVPPFKWTICCSFTSHHAMWYSWTKTCVVTTDMKSLWSYFCFVSSISVFFKRKFL